MGKNNRVKELRSILSAYMDGAYYSPMWHCVVPLLGVSETRLISALFTVFLKVESVEFRQDKNEKVWIQISRDALCYFTGGMSKNNLDRAKERLVQLGFIETEVQTLNGAKQPLWWSFNFEQFGRFFDFAKAFDCNFNPLKYGHIQEWVEFYSQNPEIVDEFKVLVKDFEKYIPQEDNLEAQKIKPPLGAGEKQGLQYAKNNPRVKTISNSRKPVKEKVSAKSKEKLDDVKPDKYIEFWNSLPNVPKCKIGYKSYEKCREFFRAFKEYRVGTELFPLDSVERQRIQLNVINRSSKKAPKCGPRQIPMRPDSEMFEMIEEAANVYKTGYAPVDKSKLPSTLLSFLYNDHSPSRGATSIFLEKLWAYPPLTIDDETYETLWNRADDDTQEMYSLFQEWYNIANGRDREARFSLKDHKHLLCIAKDWRDYYYEDLKEFGHIMPGSISIPYFKDYVGYIKYVAPVDDFYDGMPLGTFKKGGQFWKIVLGEDSCIDD